MKITKSLVVATVLASASAAYAVPDGQVLPIYDSNLDDMGELSYMRGQINKTCRDNNFEPQCYNVARELEACLHEGKYPWKGCKADARNQFRTFHNRAYVLQAQQQKEEEPSWEEKNRAFNAEKERKRLEAEANRRKEEEAKAAAARLAKEKADKEDRDLFNKHGMGNWRKADVNDDFEGSMQISRLSGRVIYSDDYIRDVPEIVVVKKDNRRAYANIVTGSIHICRHIRKDIVADTILDGDRREMVLTVSDNGEFLHIKKGAALWIRKFNAGYNLKIRIIDGCGDETRLEFNIKGHTRF